MSCYKQEGDWDLAAILVGVVLFVVVYLPFVRWMESGEEIVSGVVASTEVSPAWLGRQNTIAVTFEGGGVLQAKIFTGHLLDLRRGEMNHIVLDTYGYIKRVEHDRTDQAAAAAVGIHAGEPLSSASRPIHPDR